MAQNGAAVASPSLSNYQNAYDPAREQSNTQTPFPVAQTMSIDAAPPSSTLPCTDPDNIAESLRLASVEVHSEANPTHTETGGDGNAQAEVIYVDSEQSTPRLSRSKRRASAQPTGQPSGALTDIFSTPSPSPSPLNFQNIRACTPDVATITPQSGRPTVSDTYDVIGEETAYSGATPIRLFSGTPLRDFGTPSHPVSNETQFQTDFAATQRQHHEPIFLEQSSLHSTDAGDMEQITSSAERKAAACSEYTEQDSIPETPANVPGVEIQPCSYPIKHALSGVSDASMKTTQISHAETTRAILSRFFACSDKQVTADPLPSLTNAPNQKLKTPEPAIIEVENLKQDKVEKEHLSSVQIPSFQNEGSPSNEAARATSPEPPLGANIPDRRSKLASVKSDAQKSVRQHQTVPLNPTRRVMRARRPSRKAAGGQLPGGAHIADLKDLKATSVSLGTSSADTPCRSQRNARATKKQDPKKAGAEKGRFSQSDGMNVDDTESSDGGDSKHSSRPQRSAQKPKQRQGDTISEPPKGNASRGVVELFLTRKSGVISDSSAEDDEQLPTNRRARAHSARKRKNPDTAGRNEQIPTRKSPRISGRPSRTQTKGDDIDLTNVSDDIIQKRTRTRLRGRGRASPSLQNTPSSTRKRNAISAKGKQSKDSTNRAREEQLDMNEDEEDGDETWPSQESDRPKLNITIAGIPQRGRKKPKVYPEHMRKKISSEELSIIRIAFVKLYPAPPSNLQVMGRYQFDTGRDIDENKMKKIYDEFLKPWGDRWWDFYHEFNDEARKKKLEKSPNVNPTITEQDADTWAKEFHETHGSAKLEDCSFENL